jgi:alpha-L-rhamnosidase
MYMNGKYVRVLLGIIMLFSSALLNAQEPNSPLLSKRWPAEWVTAKDASTKGYGVYLFRKKLTLSQKPKKFLVYISADNRYKFFVNGQFVSAGPARGDITHYNYETLDLSPYLKTGNNIVSTKVWNEAEYRPEAQISLRTGFIVQGASHDEQIINTNKNWKAVVDSSYKPLKVNIPRTVYYVAGPGELVDMRKKVKDWMVADLDDAEWPAADPIETGIPKYITTTFAPTDQWMLVPSKLPAMEFTLQRLENARNVSGGTTPASFLQGKGSVTVPPHTSAKLLLDQGYLTNAYPTLLFSGGRDGEISVGYAEALYTRFPEKGNRNEVEDKQFVGRRDSILSDGTKNQSFTTLFWRTYRYVQITVNTKDQPLTLNDFYGTFTAYPFKLNAKIQADNPDLDSILNIGWRTARLCAFETYSDCPYYEQLQYIGDGRIQALISLFNSGDDRLAKNAMNQIDASRLPEGLTASRHPSYTPQYINTFSLWYIGMLHDYMMYGADVDFVKGKLAGERQILNFFKSFQGKDGSLKNPPYWSFTDWVDAKGWQSGVAPIGKDGSSAAMDLQLLLALQTAADLESKLGLATYAQEYRSYAGQLRKTIQAKYWDANKKLYADRPERDLFSQHVNSLAILTGMIKGPEALALGKKLLKNRSLAPASIYFKYYLHMALTKAGLGEDYVGWLDKWRENMQQGLTTWAEKSDLSTTRSDCHAWGSSPNIEFFRTVLGIDSDAPGFAKVRIEPHLGSVKRISGEMPHPLGTIAVQYDKATNAVITLPHGLNGRFIWGRKTYPLHSGKNMIKLAIKNKFFVRI